MLIIFFTCSAGYSMVTRPISSFLNESEVLKKIIKWNLQNRLIFYYFGFSPIQFNQENTKYRQINSRNFSFYQNNLPHKEV
jgi:hypothetical protein